MSTSNAPKVGVIEATAVAGALRQLGFQVVTGDDFRSAATIVRAELEAGSFPVIVADVKRAGIRGWAQKTASTAPLVVLGVQPPGGLADTVGATTVELPATLSDIALSIGYQLPESDLARATVSPSGELAGFTAPAEPATVAAVADVDDWADAAPDATVHVAPAGAASAQHSPTLPAWATDEQPAPSAPAQPVVPEWAGAPAPGESPAPAEVAVVSDFPEPVTSIPGYDPVPEPSTPAHRSQPAHAAGDDDWDDWDDIVDEGDLEDFDTPAAPAYQPPATPAPAYQVPVTPAPAEPVTHAYQPPATPAPAAPAYQPPATPAPAAPAYQPPATPAAHAYQPATPAAPAYQPPATPAPAIADSPLDDIFDAAAGTSVHPARLAPLVISMSGKGGVGKTTSSLGLGHIAAAAGLRTTVIDGNRGQGDLRTYLRLGRSGLPTIYDAAVTGEPEVAILTPEQVNAARPGRLAPVPFNLAMAPPDELADPAVVTPMVYQSVIDAARRSSDIVILDTQIAEAADASGIFDHLVVPALANGAWALGVTDMTRPGLVNLQKRLESFRSRNVPQDRMLIVANKTPTFTDGERQAIEQMYRDCGVFLGAAGHDQGVANSMNAGTIDPHDTSLGPVLAEVLHRVTGRAEFLPRTDEDQTQEGRRKFRLFGGRRR